ncbi:MAG: radical SAM family heme chaperone HemW [Sarcina sp.]
MKKLSLYIHIPFCKQKCLYCDFSSYAGKNFLKEDYIACLCEEIRSIKASIPNHLIETIFIGGGTPSILEVKELSSLLKTINTLTLSKNIEFSMECNPGSITDEKLQLMKDNGVNRISIGLQAVQNDLLNKLGRIHNFNEFKENFLLARKYGFRNINVDLMFGIPNQKIEHWEKTLETIIELNPEHISAYSLIIEEGTPFYNYYEKDIIQLPTEEEERAMYDLTLDILEKNNYKQYEISNFSKEGLECKHNIAYWDLKEWVGVGTAATSFIDNKKIKNVDNIEEYIALINKNKKPYESIENNSIENNMEEFMFMGLRKINGISEEEFFRRFGKEINQIYEDIICKFQKEELLCRECGKIYLSKKGIELSNLVMMEFLL